MIFRSEPRRGAKKLAQGVTLGYGLLSYQAPAGATDAAFLGFRLSPLPGLEGY